MHNKSIKNFTAALACKNNFCYSGAVRGNYNRKQGLSLRTIKKPKEKFIRIEGRITDVGYIAEGLGISKTISGGNAKIELQTKMVNKKQFIEGETRVDSNMTFYENPTVKRLAKNDLFSQIKDKIFSSEKTTFNFVKVEFDFSA
jgi:hypothetical protein